MKIILALSAVLLGALTSNAVELKPGRWVAVQKSFGTVSGGANLIITAGGRVSGRGFRANGQITRFSGTIDGAGAYKIRETGLGVSSEYEGILERGGNSLIYSNGISRRFEATKVSGNSKAGAYFGTYTGGYPWAAVVYPDGVIKAFVSDGRRFVKFTGTAYSGRVLIEDRRVRITGRIRNGRLLGEGEGAEHVRFSGKLL